MKSNKSVQWAWAFYDWANSVYNLVITSTIFPIYFAAITQPEDGPICYPFGFQPDAAYSFSLSISFFIVIILSPILSGMADNLGNKKLFLNIFCTIGSISCAAMFFFTGQSTVWLGLLLSIFASVGFWGSLVFYNAYLPEVAPKEEQDALSAKGFSMGYIGSVVLLIICLVLIEVLAAPHQKGFYTRISFVLTGIWWWGFAQYSLSKLPKLGQKPSEKMPLLHGHRTIIIAGKTLFQSKFIARFLLGFFFFSVGIQTIFLMATLFGSNEIGLETAELILTILLLQIEAIIGAYLFSRLSGKIGNRNTLIIMVLIWLLVSVAAYFMNKNHPYIKTQFYIIAGVVGLVMGGIQSLARSTYSKMLPETRNHASFFSFYDVLEKVAIVIGTAVFGYFLDKTGNMQTSALAMAFFFAASIVFLLGLKAHGWEGEEAPIEDIGKIHH